MRFEFVAAFIFCLVVGCSSEENQKTTGAIQWPDTIPWWKANNLRVIQTNLPAYEAELNVDSLVSDLKYFSANTLLINAGGIMAFYPTKLEFQYVNPYMKDNMLKDVIEKCHAEGIRVMVRFDFSRAHKSILLDALEYSFPEVGQLVQTNAPPRVEVILQQFSENKPENLNSSSTDGMILHLINLTGFSGNTYFDPLPVSNISFSIRADFKPSRIFSLASEKPVDFKWDNGRIQFSVDKLGEYDGIVIKK